MHPVCDALVVNSCGIPLPPIVPGHFPDKEREKKYRSKVSVSDIPLRTVLVHSLGSLSLWLSAAESTVMPKRWLS